MLEKDGGESRITFSVNLGRILRKVNAEYLMSFVMLESGFAAMHLQGDGIAKVLVAATAGLVSALFAFFGYRIRRLEVEARSVGKISSEQED